MADIHSDCQFPRSISHSPPDEPCCQLARKPRPAREVAIDCRALREDVCALHSNEHAQTDSLGEPLRSA